MSECVCVRERERERKGEKDRERERKTEKERERERVCESIYVCMCVWCADSLSPGGTDSTDYSPSPRERRMRGKGWQRSERANRFQEVVAAAGGDGLRRKFVVVDRWKSSLCGRGKGLMW